MHRLIGPLAAALLAAGCAKQDPAPVAPSSASPAVEIKAESSAAVTQAASVAIPRVVSSQAEITGVCTYRSTLTGKSYLYASTDDGVLQQWVDIDGAAGRLLRGVPIGKGIAACAADDAARVLYVADETIGIWRIAAESEADAGRRELVAQVAPHGTLGEEVKSIAIHTGSGHLLALDEETSAVHVYELPEMRHAGQFKLAGVKDAELETIEVNTGTGGQPDRVLLTDDKSGTVYKISWGSVAAALKLRAHAVVDPRPAAATAARTVEPAVETESVEDFGDAADDPAIWVHPTDPARSLVIGAQKKRGLEVYDLTGKRIQVLPDGRTNNVDLRQGVLIGGRKRDVVAGSNREHRTLTLYEVNPATRRLASATAAPIPTDFRDPYGLCMYHSAKSGKLYVFMNNSDNGEFRQWEVQAAGDKLGAKLVREFTVGTQAEGCAADDETGALYIAEEGKGLWRYGAEPDAGATRTLIDSTDKGGHLTADVEGIGIFRGAGGAGFIVVSNQGADNYAVYSREGANAFIGHFSIVANDTLGIDGASETDGLDVTSTPLGSAFPQGLLVVQDGRNITPAERQNFKLVPWERVQALLESRKAL